MEGEGERQEEEGRGAFKGAKPGRQTVGEEGNTQVLSEVPGAPETKAGL